MTMADVRQRKNTHAQASKIHLGAQGVSQTCESPMTRLQSTCPCNREKLLIQFGHDDVWPHSAAFRFMCPAACLAFQLKYLLLHSPN
jgi:hypothetical protein